MMAMVVWWRRVLLVTVCLSVCHCLESNQMVFSPPSQCWANQSYSSVSLSYRDCQDGAGGRSGVCECLPGWRLSSWGPWLPSWQLSLSSVSVLSPSPSPGTGMRPTSPPTLTTTTHGSTIISEFLLCTFNCLLNTPQKDTYFYVNGHFYYFWTIRYVL